jgi:hypothetical protein
MGEDRWYSCAKCLRLTELLTIFPELRRLSITVLLSRSGPFLQGNVDGKKSLPVNTNTAFCTNAPQFPLTRYTPIVFGSLFAWRGFEL